MKTNKFCSFCKRTNHTRDECYHRLRRLKERHSKTNTNTEPHKTRERGYFSKIHNDKTLKETPRDSNKTKNCEEVITEGSTEIVKSDKSSKIELKVKIKRLKNKLEKLVLENKFLKEENLTLSLLYFSSDKTPFIDNWKKDNKEDE